jgi:sulfotransferase family protein
MIADALPGVPYGRFERLLHRLAFASLEAQKGLGQVENRVFAARLADEAARRPVFVTSLPRAGTTVMLEVLAGLPEFASATYRHMPFTLAPLIWQRFARRFQRAGGTSERAHGDGIEVGVDSPEAFEEMLWMAFWPDHYRADTIVPWAAEAEAGEFAAFFRRHMAKIVMLEGPPARRYLSKNNANIARLGLIERLFPDATLVVPVREPFAQVASLMRQHARFGALHARDPFALTYMEGLGHFEFGAALRPFAFTEPAPDPGEAHAADFWLGYWADAYEWVLETAGERVVFVDHDGLSAAPGRHLPPLAAALDLRDPAALAAAAPRFRSARAVAPPQDAAAALVRRAAAVHAELRRRCLAPAAPDRQRGAA